MWDFSITTLNKWGPVQVNEQQKCVWLILFRFKPKGFGLMKLSLTLLSSCPPSARRV